MLRTMVVGDVKLGDNLFFFNSFDYMNSLVALKSSTLDVLDEFESYSILYVCTKFVILNSWIIYSVMFLFFYYLVIISFSKLGYQQNFSSHLLASLQKTLFKTLKDNFSLLNSRYRLTFFVLFLLIAFINLWGLFPFSFTQTTRLKVVAFFSMIFFVSANLFGFIIYGIL